MILIWVSMGLAILFVFLTVSLHRENLNQTASWAYARGRPSMTNGRGMPRTVQVFAHRCLTAQQSSLLER